MKHNISYFFKEGISNMFSHGFMSFAAIGITVACLLIMGTFSLVAVNANANLKDLQKENAVLAFVEDSLTDEQAKNLQGQITSLDNVSGCTFVSRQQARDEYVQKYDEDGLYSDLDASIFRHRYVIRLADPEKLDQTIQEVKGIQGIEKVRADEDISNGFVTLRNIASVISIALITILFVVSVFIISNTIKLTTFDRRDEIAIMKMVGATNGFIRWPFVFEGLMMGICGAAVAFGLQWLLYEAVVKGIANSDTLQLVSVIPFSRMWGSVAGVFAAAGILIGVGGSLTAIRKFLQV
ncbi:MAG: permease-like cell division protein FtsX [Oscillibacter sp.]|nr:permease-like cell division protein FtsX [Oscillibacter sp.]